MFPEHLIKSENVLCNARARSKKHCLEILSELLAQSNPDISHEEIFSRLIERERLGCTALSKGTAFPHCRVPGAIRSTGALIRLSEPVDFDASDGESVDLVFGLMVPEELDSDDIKAIDRITSLLSDRSLSSSLRDAKTSRVLYERFATGFEKIAGARATGDLDEVNRKISMQAEK